MRAPATAVYPAAVAVDPLRLTQLFDDAVDLPDTERAAYLDAACGDDLALRAAVDTLLRADADAAAADEFLAAPPALPADPPLSRVGRYFDLEPIGEGGMGEVYAAFDRLLQRKVALKLLRASTPHASEMLIREGVLLARLAHPNVVPLYDIGEHEDRVYLVMELIDGVTLRTWLKDQPNDWRVRLPPLLDAARGLAAAHDLGFVHGDIKPDNLMVGRDGRGRVIDFGVARHVDGPVLGVTVAYAAPELLRDADSRTARADLYSFCVTVHECLYGERPPSAAARGDLPPRLVAAVRRGLADDPAARFPSMHALIAELAAVLGRDPETDLSIARGARTAVFSALVVVAAGVDVLVHVRGFGGPAPDADDLVRLAAFALAGVALAVAAAWSRLRTRINRQLALMLLLGVAAMLLHRLIAARFGEGGAATLAGDMALIGALAGTAGLLLQTWLLGPALVFLAGCTAATLAPDSAPIAMSAGVWTTALIGTVALRARAS